jgi:endogenous inhibitor of DNA gyrase (YacG/DUF329 family)
MTAKRRRITPTTTKDECPICGKLITREIGPGAFRRHNRAVGEQCPGTGRTLGEARAWLQAEAGKIICPRCGDEVKQRDYVEEGERAGPVWWCPGCWYNFGDVDDGSGMRHLLSMEEASDDS